MMARIKNILVILLLGCLVAKAVLYVLEPFLALIIAILVMATIFTMVITRKREF